MLALLAIRDDARYLPGYLANIAPQMDGIIALDDGSSDRSDELLKASPAVLEVMRRAPATTWDEPANHRALVAAALRHGGEWALCVDADERVEEEFRVRAERVIRRGRHLGLEAFAVRVRELWDSPHQFRVDGVWGRKAVARLFRVHDDHQFDSRPLHGIKAPLQARVGGRHVLADLVIYHLRMIHRRDRLARQNRYETLDPQARWQPGLGYAYLTDERGLQVRPVPERRGYRPCL